MKFTLLISLLLIVGCTKQENAEKIRSTVKLSIQMSSKIPNEILFALNDKKIKGIDNSKELQIMYQEAVKANKNCIT